MNERSLIQPQVEPYTGLVGLLRDVMEIADQANSPNQALQGALERLCRGLGWPVGQVFIRRDDSVFPPGSPRGDTFEFAGGIRSLEAPEGKDIILASQGMRFQPGSGWVGRAAAERKPLWVQDLFLEDDDTGDPRLRLAIERGMQGLVVYPVLVDDEVLAVLEFFTSQPFQPTLAVLDALEQVSGYVGRTVACRRTAEDFVQDRKARAATAHRRSEWLGRMSHAIRTPMNAVLGMTDVLLGSGLSVEQTALAESVAAASAASTEILGDVFEFLQAELGPPDLQSQPFSLRRLLQETLAAARPRAELRETALESRVDASLPDALVSDPARLRQILTHLLRHAVDQSPGGTVRLRAMDAGAAASRPGYRRLELAVADTGPGIAPRSMTHLFEPFAELTTSELSDSNDSGNDSGLRLALCQRLCRLLGTEIRVESELGRDSVPSGGSRGGNTVFRFSLMVEEAAADVALEPSARRATPRTPKERPLQVLVVEDNAINQTVAVKMLEAMRHEIEVAATGWQALSALEQGSFDVILMDIEMPGIDGVETTRRIRRQWPAERQPRIVAVTARAMAGDRERCLAAGMDDYLSKPITLERLRRALE